MDDLFYSMFDRYWERGTIYLLAAFLPFLLTYLLTYLSYRTTLRSNKQEKKPPVAPYWIPFVGHLVPFLQNPAKALLSITNDFGKNAPSRVKIAGRDIYLISGISYINFIWKNSESFTPKTIQLACMQTVLKLNKNGADFCQSDDSGRTSRPNPTSHVEPNNRIWFHTHDSAARFLSGSHLKRLTSHFHHCLEKRVGTLDLSHQFGEETDLYTFIYDMLFPAQIEVLFGSSFLRLNPNFPSDFRDFHRGLSYLIQGYPRWLVPRAWDARERCLEGIKKYHASLDKETDETTRDGDEKDFIDGSDYIRYRKQMHAKMKGLDADSIASSELGVIWAATSNMITSVFWSVVELTKDPYLLSKIRDEIIDSASVSSDSNPSSLGLDAKKLATQPLLQCVFAEVLRLYAYVFLVNTSEHRDFSFRGWMIPRDQMVAISSHTAHMDTNVWNTGPTGNHPLHTFWAERFLIRPSNRRNGLLKKSWTTSQIPTLSKDWQDEEHTENAASGFVSNTPGSPTVFLGGLSSIWMPFGGGHGLCPGRHLAKEETLLGVAMLITSFDFESIEYRDMWDRLGLKRGNREKKNLDLDMRYFGTGVLPPKKEVKFKIRRRGKMQGGDNVCHHLSI